MSGQADYYIRLAMLVEDNPDLPVQLLKDVLEGREEIRAGLGDEYVFGTLS
jgi:hypothetical protein